MKQRKTIFFIFIICLVITLVIFSFAKKKSTFSAGLIIQIIFSPLQKTMVKSFQVFHAKSEIDQLKTDNIALKAELAKFQLTVQDNVALRDQFQTVNPSPKTLIPAEIVGIPSFIPGINTPEELIIDKGEKDGIQEGGAVVYKDNLIGVITNINDHFAQVTILSNKSISFTAKTSEKNAFGIIKGEGNGQMLMDNVVLSDSIQTGDTVVTAGSTSLNGKGYPPGLIVGRITSVEKSPSDLFQKANVESLIDLTRTTIIFVIAGEK